MENQWDLPIDHEAGSYPETIVSPIDGAEMVLVPEGPFLMGSTEEEIGQIFRLDQRRSPVFITEIPARTVDVKAFYIDRYPVTNYQYGKFLEQAGHRPPHLWNEPEWNRPMQPVVYLGWEDARAYARWTGKSLPREEQWEKAARGTDGRWWAWGDSFHPNRCNSQEYGLERTSEIGIFHEGVSPYGCYDMCGNVWEMCEGRWLRSLPPMRGGCFLGSASYVRVTCRWSPEDIHGGAHWLGFRCVKEIKPAPVRPADL